MSSVEGWKAFKAYFEDRDSELPFSVKTDKLWRERLMSDKRVRYSDGNLTLVERKTGAERRVRGFIGVQLKDSAWTTKPQAKLL